MDSKDTGTDMEKGEKHEHYAVHVAETQVDDGARFDLGRELDPAEALRVRKKIDRHILPMMCGKSSTSCSLARFILCYHVQCFTGRSHSIFGIQRAIHVEKGCNSWIRQPWVTQQFVRCSIDCLSRILMTCISGHQARSVVISLNDMIDGIFVSPGLTRI